MRVLLVGPNIDEKAAQALRRNRILVDTLPRPQEMADNFAEDVYDVLVHFADNTLPSLPKLLQGIRDDGISLPILIVASHASARDRVRVLDAGADDFLTAPYLMAELVARVRALGRRAPVLQPQRLTVGDAALDLRHFLLSGPGGEIRVSGKEMQLLELFLLHPGQILPRETLQQKVWGLDSESSYNNIEVYLSLLRRKLRSVGSSVRIVAERGFGYYLDANSELSLAR